jgi:hypothetical protein
VELRDVDTDDDLIPDACDPCPTIPTRDASGQNTYDLGGGPDDGDHDGVPDACDNCPADYNPYTADHVQMDSDGDGVGNACDGCAHSEVTNTVDLKCCDGGSDCPGPGNSCVGGPGGPHPDDLADCDKRCARPPDADGDGVADACDNCPPPKPPYLGPSIANTDQKDSDRDGVGDACDDCPGWYLSEALGQQSEDINQPCPGDLSCKALNPGSVCVPPHLLNSWDLGSVTTARCSKGFDSDGDGVGDKCDDCKNTANPFQGPGYQPNCNVHIEVTLGDVYPFKGDACDSTPCADLDLWTVKPKPGKGQDPGEKTDAWVAVAYSPLLLPQGQVGAYPTVGAPLADIGLRRCSCGTLDDPGSPFDCSAPDECPLMVERYDDPNESDWKIPELYQPAGPDLAPPLGLFDPTDAIFDPSAEVTGIQVVDPLAPSAIHPPPPGFAPPGTWTGRGNWDLGGPASPFIPLIEEVWSHVTSVANIGPDPSPAAAAILFRPRSNHYEVAVLSNPTESLPTAPEEIILGPCDSLKGPVCPLCPLMRDMPLWVIDPAEKVFAKGEVNQVDLTDKVGRNALSALLEPSVRWAGVAENGAWLKDEDPRLASLAEDGTRVDAVLIQKDGVLVNQTGTPLPSGLDSSGAVMVAPQQAPASRVDFGVVLSARESALFVLGGVSAMGRAAGDLWRFDTGSGQWRQLLVSGPIPERVLTATYRPDNRSLYVIDEVAAGTSASVRMLQIDLAVQTSRILLTFERPSERDGIFLVNAPRGDLLLVLSNAATGRTTGTLVGITPIGEPSLLQRLFETEGLVAREPTMTDRGVTLPLADGGAVRNKFIGAEDLGERSVPPPGQPSGASGKRRRS